MPPEEPEDMEKRLRRLMDNTLSHYGLYMRAGPHGKQSLTETAASQASEGEDWLIEASAQGDAVTVLAQIPGKSLEQLALEIGEESVAISLKRAGSIPKLISLPCKVLPQSAKAEMRNGVLKVILQKK